SANSLGIEKPHDLYTIARTGRSRWPSDQRTYVMVRDLVSVVIPSYNMNWCVTRAIASCQAQSMAVNEIIVVDDCSTDNTEAVVRDLMARDPRIKYFKLQKNGGHLAALRFGAREAVSDWVALLDADDELTPDSI